jgi:uncharacterized protein (TIGR02001 family)
MSKTFTLAAVAVAVLATPLAAQASDGPISGNIALTSKYKFRGQDQSDPAKGILPAVQGGFDFESGGFYAGNWNSSVGFLGGTEMDFYAGFKGEVEGFSYDVGLLQYYYPGPDSSGNTTEIYGSVGFGPVTAKYSSVVSSRWFGIDGGRGTGYLEVGAEFEVSGVTLSAHLGTTTFASGAKRNGAVNYSDYKLGAGWDLGKGFGAEVAFIGATKKSDWGDVNKNRIVFTLTKSL